MKPKKNPKADLSRKWILFFQIGLIAVLLLALNMLNWTTEAKIAKDNSIISIDEITEEEPPVTMRQLETPPPPPPPIPQVIEIIPDDSNDKETEITSTEPIDQDFAEPDEIIDAPEDEDIEVPIDFIEMAPLFPGCETFKDKKKQKQCFSDNIRSFIQKEFDTGLGEKFGLTGINTVQIRFVVSKTGKIENIQTRAPHPGLEKEALRVVNMLPQMKPGIQNGKPVAVSYTIPLRFKVQN